MRYSLALALAGIIWLGTLGATAEEPRPAEPATLEQQLLAEGPPALVAAALEQGDARRGAVVFYQPYLACTRCHAAGDKLQTLGPDLARLPKDATPEHLVESVLEPSKKIRKGFEPVTIVTDDGLAVTGLLHKEGNGQLQIRDPAQDGKVRTFALDQIEGRANAKVSIMPAGVVNQVGTRQQFLDLVRYLVEIARGGPERADELRPPPSLYAARPIPEYEKQIDHAGMIADLDRQSYQRGEAIYNRLCINCHGTQDRPGSLPTSLRFASGKFKNGSDPYSMYQTLTRGFGMMVPQTWMVPQQKYDVIHYVRQAYLKPHNPSQYAVLTPDYLARLPEGTTRGPKPTNIEPWSTMDYGPSLIASYEAGSGGGNIAYKGIAVRLDAGPGGVSRGRYWMLYEHDTLRMAAAWSGKGFIDYEGIMFNGRHAVHPHLVGSVQAANPTAPGWADRDGGFADPRPRGRDGKPYGPLPRDWAHYRGLYHYGNQVLLSYTVGETELLEMPGVLTEGPVVFTRTFNVGPRVRDLVLQVAHEAEGAPRLQRISAAAGNVVLFGPEVTGEAPDDSTTDQALRFDGATYVELQSAEGLDLTGRDYTIAARIKTRRGGSILCQTAPEGPWVHDGKTLFVRGGKLTFDIGWVGAVRSRTSVDDDRWHHVAMTWRHKDGRVQLYVDGQLDGQGSLKPKAPVEGHVVRLGFTAPNFPRPRSFFHGQLSYVRFYGRALADDELAALAKDAEHAAHAKDLLGDWNLAGLTGDTARDATSHGHDGRVVRGSGGGPARGPLVAAVSRGEDGLAFLSEGGDLRLRIPQGQEPLRFTLYLARTATPKAARELASSLPLKDEPLNLALFTEGGPPRWGAKVTTQVVRGADDGPLAADVLTRPTANPWHARVRLTGLDFLAGGREAVLCAWDGDVWRVRGIGGAEALSWQRIASGLFQPLGIKVVDGDIYVTCRDQLVILRDLNGDGETDFYENLNSDHQVTEHFHEFAMGLQTDAEGNFYYAKSARHALPALVPHHGTLLRVSRDGSRTDIVATGFRAANGVCVNPDGTFIVTDQEGHWNPKNRINWVTEGGFYGNMFGYHDVTDSSDDAMEQPLCWITNSFDRSPAELLWVEGDTWKPLQGSLLNLSYGYGKVYVVPHERVEGQVQGGMCELPIPQFPTGVMRGRFHPVDGQLYLCGMFAWAGTQQQPGGFYRLRYTGMPLHLPVGLKARKQGMQLTFSGALDPKTAADATNYRVKTWSLKRTANYGSKHYDEKRLDVTAARVSDDGRTVQLEMPEIAPTWCMEIRYTLQSADGQPVNGMIHNTVHRLGP